MRIDNSSTYDLYNLTTLHTGQKTAATEQAELARASYRYNQSANAAAVLEAEYVDTNATQTQPAASTSQTNTNRLAAELYYLNNELSTPPQDQSNISNKQAQRYQKLATPQAINRGTLLNIVA